MAISLKFIELHGGEMWVESQFGKGSTFYFIIPVDKSKERKGKGER